MNVNNWKIATGMPQLFREGKPHNLKKIKYNLLNEYISKTHKVPKILNDSSGTDFDTDFVPCMATSKY